MKDSGEKFAEHCMSLMADIKTAIEKMANAAEGGGEVLHAALITLAKIHFELCEIAEIDPVEDYKKTAEYSERFKKLRKAKKGKYEH